MVDTIKELAELSRKLNQKSDTLNATITSINEKLAKLNLGVEAWTGSIEESDPYYHQTDENARFPLHDETWLGYCKFDTGWTLATKVMTLRTVGDEEEVVVDAEQAAPLLKASRDIRAKAMKLVPQLLDAIKIKAENLLDSIAKAEAAAEKL